MDGIEHHNWSHLPACYLTHIIAQLEGFRYWDNLFGSNLHMLPGIYICSLVFSPSWSMKCSFHMKPLRSVLMHQLFILFLIMYSVSLLSWVLEEFNFLVRHCYPWLCMDSFSKSPEWTIIVQALVEKDWLAFGHPFSDRLGMPTVSGNGNMPFELSRQASTGSLPLSPMRQGSGSASTQAQNTANANHSSPIFLQVCLLGR